MSVFRNALHWCWLLGLLLLPGRGSSQAAPATLDGLWKGQLKLPGGQLEVVYRLIKLADGNYFASLDVPLQKVRNLSVAVVISADTVRLLSAEANSRFEGRLSADGKQLEGMWQQPGFKTPLLLLRTALASTALAPPKTRLTPPYREEEVGFNNTKNNLKFSGMLTVPAGAGPFPAVVLLSDVGPQDRNGTVGDFAPLGLLADYLTRRGVAVLRFDDRGVGKSTGPPQSTTIELVSDAQAALNYLRTRPEVDLDHLGLIGHGEGGNVALLAATQPLPPAFVVGLAPYGLTGQDIALQQQEATLKALQIPADQVSAVVKRQQSMFEIIRQTTDNVQAQAIVANMLKQNNAALDNATAQASATEMVSPRYRYYLTFNPAEALPRVACPVLLLYGSADTILNPDNNAGALAKGLKGNKDITVRKLPGVNHLFQPDPANWPIVSGEQRPNFAPTAEETIRAWIVTQAAKK